MALETSSCSAVMDVDMNDTNMPRTIVQENHSGALSMSSSVVPDILLPDTIFTETNSRDASDIYCNPINTCLKLWRDCTSGAEIASRHTLYDDPFLLHEKDSMVHKSDGRVVQQFPFENSYLTCTLDGSLSTTTPKVPVIDFYAPLPGFLCSEQSQCGYMTFKRESSTDSSSASSSRNFTSNSIDRFAVNIAEQMVSDFKTFLPDKKQKILLKDKWKGQIPSSCYQQYENSFCNDAVRRSLSRSSSSVDDDADITKLDINVPVSLTLSHMKLMSQQYGLSDSYLHGSGGTRLKADDERLTFQIALQDPPEDAVVTICGHVFCNQCICEHLIGDDNICPSGHCKVRFTVASVFSRNTLKRCLAGLTDCDDSSVGCVSNTVSKSEIFKERLSSGSSKINAALEILQSLPITSCSSSKSDLENSCDRSTISDENAVNTVGGSYSVDSDSKYRGQYKSSNAQATEKAIVFSQWTRMLDLLEVPLKASGIQFRRLDRTMSVNDRDKAVKYFNTLPEVTVMIMSLKAASLGLNMIAACHVLLLDLWWNPTTENQAIDRAHRIGQTHPVTVFRLTVRDTVEDRILALQEKKREMVASAFGEDESGTRQSGLTVEDVEYLFMA